MWPLGFAKMEKKKKGMLIRHGISTSALRTEIKIDSRLKEQWLIPLVPVLGSIFDEKGSKRDAGLQKKKQLKSQEQLMVILCTHSTKQRTKTRSAEDFS